MNSLKHVLTATLAGVALITRVAVAQSPRSADAPPPPPITSKVRPARPAADMQAVLDAQARLGGRAIHTLTPAQARRNPTPTDGVKAVMTARGMSTAPDPSVTTRDFAYGSDPLQKVRIYTPTAAANAGALPVVVYYHGGGWVIADLDVYDAAPRLMAQQLNAVVVSVEYRKAPEVKFPGQHEDAAAAYRWVLDNAPSFNGDTQRLALAGESAGGNLAIATAIVARDSRLTMPGHILAVYPIANSAMGLRAKVEHVNAKPLATPDLAWFAHYFSRTKADLQDRRINLVAANLRGLPPVTIINADIDPLRSDGETLATALRRANVRVQQQTFPGVTHEFFGMGKVVRGAYDASTYAIARMRPALQAR